MIEFGLRYNPTIREMESRLNGLSDQLQRKGFNAGLSAVAKPIKDRMRAVAPRKTGALRRSIGHRQLNLREKSEEGLRREDRAIWIGPIRKVADPGYQRAPGKKIPQYFKAKWIEYGTKPHDIPEKHFQIVGRGKNRRIKKMKVFGKFLTRVRHPGIHRPRPFIDPAFQAEAGRVDELFLSGIDRYLNKL